MKKKKIMKRIEQLETLVLALRGEKCQCKHCENFKAKTVTFKRFIPMPEIREPLCEEKNVK